MIMPALEIDKYTVMWAYEQKDGLVKKASDLSRDTVVELLRLLQEDSESNRTYVSIVNSSGTLVPLESFTDNPRYLTEGIPDWKLASS